MLQLVERTAALGLHFPKKIENFKPEDARLAYNGHMESWGFDKREAPHPRGVEQPRVFVTRPPLENCTWMVDASDAKLRELLALPVAERAKKLPIFASAEAAVITQLAGRGYTPQSLVYLEDDTALPPVVDAAAIPEPEPEQEGADVSAPARLTLPPKMVPLPHGKPAAASIVTQFEDYVVSGDDVYSPMRLWTLVARQAHEDLMKQTTLFGRRAALYLYIVSREVDPTSILLKESELRESKDEWAKTLPEEQRNVIGWAQAALVATQRVAARGAAAGLQAMATDS